MDQDFALDFIPVAGILFAWRNVARSKLIHHVLIIWGWGLDGHVKAFLISITVIHLCIYQNGRRNDQTICLRTQRSHALIA